MKADRVVIGCLFVPKAKAGELGCGGWGTRVWGFEVSHPSPPRELNFAGPTRRRMDEARELIGGFATWASDVEGEVR